MIPLPPRAFHLSLHPDCPGSWVPPNERATLLSLAPELGVAEIGQDLPKLQERMFNSCPGGWWRNGNAGHDGKQERERGALPPGPTKPRKEASPEGDMEAEGLRAACAVSRRRVYTNMKPLKTDPRSLTSRGCVQLTLETRYVLTQAVAERQGWGWGGESSGWNREAATDHFRSVPALQVASVLQLSQVGLLQSLLCSPTPSRPSLQPPSLLKCPSHSPPPLQLSLPFRPLFKPQLL